MMMEFKALSRTFWGRYIWARGYFVASSGNVADEVIVQYIEQQDHESPDDNFKVDDDKSLVGLQPILEATAFRR